MRASSLLFWASSGCLAAVAAFLATAVGCSAGGNASKFGTGGDGLAAQGGQGVGGSLFGGAGGQGGGIVVGGSGGAGAQGGGIVDPCASECGDEELCDGIHAGIDDDCDLQVDEGCLCNTGMVQSCFKGEPAYRDEPGCFPGSQHCTEFGFWDECIGGVHASDHCYDEQVGCHAITTYPFVTVDLKDGTGDFSADATSESWTVVCPTGIDPCPGVTGTNPADNFQPLQSGEYTVTYHKVTADGEDECTYPLFVGAPGLRVELEWEHGVEGDSDTGVDVDLHLHKPADTHGWGGDQGNDYDCAYDNCVMDEYDGPPTIANWFTGANPPDPVNWFEDPVDERNTCYYAPRGKGDLWRDHGQGCRNPRLDLDNIYCDPTIGDVDNPSFCAPENINIDYPPKDQWIRIGVHYYSNHGKSYPVHPRIRVFCDAALVAELGPQGYNAPVTFAPADGAGQASGNRFWLVADVKFLADECVDTRCVVEPIFYDPVQKSALLTTDTLVQSSYGPPYPNY